MEFSFKLVVSLTGVGVGCLSVLSVGSQRLVAGFTPLLCFEKALSISRSSYLTELLSNAIDKLSLSFRLGLRFALRVDSVTNLVFLSISFLVSSNTFLA